MEISILVFLFMLLLALAIGAAFGFLFARQRSIGELRSSEARVASLREQLLLQQGQVEQLRISNREFLAQQERHTSFSNALAPIQKQLDLVNQQVHQLDLRTTGTSERLLNQLANDAKLQAELRAATSELNAALHSTSARGNWGEIQLQRILEAAGMMTHVDFDLQQNSSSFTDGMRNETARSLRPDAIIHLPNGGHIAIDAKAPMDAYLKAQTVLGTSNTATNERKDYLALHAKALNTHVKELIKRNYPADFSNSPQITILFLPSEALLSEALEQDATLLERSLRNGIVPASPSSLLALLRAVGSIWATSAATTEAAKIVELGRTLVNRLNVTTKHLASLGKSLGASVKHYNAAVGSIESRVLSTARTFESIQTEGMEVDSQLSQLPSQTSQIRDFVSPEFSERN